MSCFAISVSADETTDTTDTSNYIFDDPIGTGVLGNTDNYYYVKSPFDSSEPNVYFNLGSGNFQKGYISDRYWLLLYNPQGSQLILLTCNSPLRAASPSVTANQYQVISPVSSGVYDDMHVFYYCPTGYSATTSSGRVELPAGCFRQMSDIERFVYSRDDYDTVDNFRCSSDDIYYIGTLNVYDNGLDEDYIIFKATPFNPVIKKASALDSVSIADKYEDTLGSLIAGIVEGLDFLSDFFNPLFDFFGEFWDEHVVGYLQTFIDNFTYYFKKFAIPDISFFEEHFDSLYYGLSSKFPILSDISDMYAAVRLAFESADNTPDISFTYQGVSYNLLDLSLFDPVMPYVHSIILVFAYYRFLSGLYKKLPSYI